jgi:hypothetical protein
VGGWSFENKHKPNTEFLFFAPPFLLSVTFRTNEKICNTVHETCNLQLVAFLFKNATWIKD